MGRRYLAFDLGASSGRAIAGDLKNGKLTLTEIHRFENGPVEKDGALYWDFDALWSEIKTGLKKAIAAGKPIHSVAADTWGVDYVLLKKDGTFARPPYHYRDKRNNGADDKLFEKVSEKDLYSRTGLQRMSFNTLFQLCAHQEQHPQDLQDTTLLLMPDAITYLLCGKAACEYTDASTTNLLDAKKRSWDMELIERAGLPKTLFPEIAKPSTVAGVLRKELQEELACGPISVCHAGSHDTASAVAAVPAPGSGHWAYVSCGTWALLGAEIDKPILSELARKAHFTNEGGLDNKIRFLSNIMGTWLLQETRRVWGEQGNLFSFPEMEQMALSAQGFSTMVNPNDSRFLAPGDMPSNIVEACLASGQAAPDSKAEVLRCIYDSLALCFRAKLEELQKLLRVRYDYLNIVGGGIRARLLMQSVADCLGIPVLAGPVEATAAGNLLAQARAAGDVCSLSASRDIVRMSFGVEEFKPEGGCKDAWDQAFAKYKKLFAS
ncbi:MAG: hypothetical protein A2X49_04700 [Lentisphaerae bacterium GWF2_52_8]|nr:MAG: hypothetical protein A2X49_04700 [Lentisphaerae bacterium GWF2_52_8]